MGQEKRKYVRWRERVRVAYSLDTKDSAYNAAFTEDLSEIGLQILVANKLATGQIVRLKIEFVYDTVPVEIIARVVHAAYDEGRYRMGLEFIEMNDFQKHRLKCNLDKVRQDIKGEINEAEAYESD